MAQPSDRHPHALELSTRLNDGFGWTLTERLRHDPLLLLRRPDPPATPLTTVCSLLLWFQNRHQRSCPLPASWTRSSCRHHHRVSGDRSRRVQAASAGGIRFTGGLQTSEPIHTHPMRFREAAMSSSDHRVAMLRITASASSEVRQPCSPDFGLRMVASLSYSLRMVISSSDQPTSIRDPGSKNSKLPWGNTRTLSAHPVPSNSTR